MAKYEDIELPDNLRASTPPGEYSAQCWGGPEHGNLISATVKEWSYTQIVWMGLDGENGRKSRTVLRGKYAYELHTLHGREGYMWMWHGPGADGDTMERIRKGE